MWGPPPHNDSISSWYRARPSSWLCWGLRTAPEPTLRCPQTLVGGAWAGPIAQQKGSLGRDSPEVPFAEGSPGRFRLNSHECTPSPPHPCCFLFLRPLPAIFCTEGPSRAGRDAGQAGSHASHAVPLPGPGPSTAQLPQHRREQPPSTARCGPKRTCLRSWHCRGWGKKFLALLRGPT